LLLVFDLGRFALRELGEGAASSGFVIVMQEVLLVLAPVGRTVTAKMR
jgi:hypothetical protein